MADRHLEFGRAVLLAQLEHMKTWDLVWADEKAVTEIVAAIGDVDSLRLPEEYKPALAAYWKEFVEDPGGAVHLHGPFYRSDEEIGGIRNKLWVFYDPLIEELAIRHHRDSVEFLLVIDVDYEEASKVVILWASKLLWLDWSKARRPRFTAPTLQAVLEELGKLYGDLAASLRRASGED